MSTFKTILLVSMSSLVLYACSSGGGAPSSGATASVGGPYGGGSVGQLSGQPLDLNGEMSSLSQEELMQINTFHFDFDSSNIAVDDKAAIIAHARHLSANEAQCVLLAGNTDNRGSREYNIALGWRRAQSVEHLMLLNGARKSQLKLVSYGQEKPVSLGNSESDYAQNRRVDLTDVSCGLGE